MKRKKSDSLDPTLIKKIQETEANPRLDITGLSPKTIIHVRTQNSTYTMVLVNPKKGRVAVLSNGRKITKPTMAILRGSTFFGGNWLEQKKVAVGLALEFNFPEGRRITTSDVQRFITESNNKEARRIIKAALSQTT